MRIPTSEQQEVLDDPGRVRVVRAAPGSGKTWLVAEIIRQELRSCNRAGSGIAALSFTRVGGEEIRKAVGHELAHPHFVGTIDSFLFRYIVRPFITLVMPSITLPRLVAAEWGAEGWNYYGHKKKSVLGNTGINVFGCVSIDESQGKPLFAFKAHPARPLSLLSENEQELVREAKKRVWRESGLLTHSDAALLASVILEHKEYGQIVIAEVVRRFPFVIVDELQDTGFYLGKCVKILLEDERSRGVLVGDPDQAIYEFTGAKPGLFAKFESIPGAVRFSLTASQRCPAEVLAAALHLKDSDGVLSSARSEPGRAILIRYDKLESDVTKLVHTIQGSRGEEGVKVIARAGSTIANLKGKNIQSAPSLHCPALTRIHEAVILFRNSRPDAALKYTQSAINRAIFGHDNVGAIELAKAQIDPLQWKSLAARCLLAANATSSSGTFFEWQHSVGETLKKEICQFEGGRINIVENALKPQKRAGYDNPADTFLPERSLQLKGIQNVTFQTVHAVKGETHDLTIFVCPDVSEPHCPSTVWWSTDDTKREEKRIAYVAMTRTQSHLIVCVSNNTYQRMLCNRTEFLQCFECFSVEEYSEMIS